MSARASAPSVPGRTRSSTSAWLAMPTRRGSTATIFIPRFLAATISWARIKEVELGLCPQSKKGVAVGHVGCGDFNAERVTEAGIFVPVTDVGRGYPAGTAKTVKKPRQPALRVRDGCSAAGAFGQSN